MICNRCGARIPDELLEQEVFACPECGTEYEYEPEPRYNRYAEFEREAREDDYEEAFENDYEDEPYEDEVYDDEPYEDEPYEDEVYDEPYEDEEYYDDEPYDDEPYPQDGYADDYNHPDYVPESQRVPPRPSVTDVLRALPQQKWFVPAMGCLAVAIIAVVLTVVLLNRPTAAERNVTDYILMFKNGGLPIGEVVQYSAESDPNGLLGTDGQYTGKAAFEDTRLPQAEGSAPNGGSIEVFASKDDMLSRKAFITSLAEASPEAAPYLYESSDGLALVSVSTDMPVEEAMKYDDVLHGKTVVPGPVAPTPEPTPEATPVPSATERPEAKYENVEVPAGKYVVGERFPVGVYTFRVGTGTSSCIVSVYDTVDSASPSAVYELSTLGTSRVDGISLVEGNGIAIEGEPVICDVY